MLLEMIDFVVEAVVDGNMTALTAINPLHQGTEIVTVAITIQYSPPPSMQELIGVNHLM